MCSTLKEAFRILKPPLVFGDARQIAARRFIEEVERAKAEVLACDVKHEENFYERQDEADTWNKAQAAMDMQEELFKCDCSRASSEALMEVAKQLVEEWW